MSEWVVDAPAAGRPGKEGAQDSPASTRPPETVAVAPTPKGETPTATRTAPKAATMVAALSIYSLLVALAFYDTLASMVTIWARSQTFAHGFLILPISLWLTWRLRGRFNRVRVQPEPRALLLVPGAGMVWLLANLVDVQGIQQLAFVAILVSGIWAIAGTGLARAFAFPLGFLFLAVPMGAGLIPPLMAFTADTTEFLLRVTGIPVFREGMYLTIPTGTWSVIEECSGVRYLIASFTLGLVYAHLTYTSLRRRLVFMVFAIITPILANSVRAYAVVMVGHLSNMRYGIGADHLFFGWAFFGLVMLLMFWVGSFWQEEASAAAIASPPAPTPRRHAALSWLPVTGLALLCAGIWPAFALAMNRNTEPVAAAVLSIPSTAANWSAAHETDWDWYPAQPGADRELDQVYLSSPPESLTVAVHLRQYLQQSQGTELVNTANPWRPDRNAWRLIEQRPVRINLHRPVMVDEAQVVSSRQNLLVWSWYRIDDRNTANPYLIKLLEAKQQILEGRRQGTRVFVATPLGEDRTEARQLLQEFVTLHLPAIEESLVQGLADKENPGAIPSLEAVQ